MALVSKPYTFSAGATIIASEHNSDFDTLYNDYNGNITNANISNSAAIGYSKLALTGSILNADINASAAIAYSKLNITGAVLNADLAGSITDSKLDTISTAGKVSGAALTSLSSIPSGAGVIPVANLPSFGLTLVSATTFSSENSKTITGLTTGTPYLILIDLVSASANENLFFFPNGTLSTIDATANYTDGGTNKLRLNPAAFGNGGIGSFVINFRTRQGDTTKTVALLKGWSSTSGLVEAYAVLDSDANLSSITISSESTMTLTGTAYLYKYATS